jgi:hypothetical protein
MRKVLISLLLASAAATPALAERPHWSDNNQSAQEERHQSREDRSSAREERSSSQSQSQSSSYSRPERAEPRSVEPRQQQQQVEFRARSNGSGPNVDAVGRADRRDVEAIRGARANSGPAERTVEAYRERQQAVQANRQGRVEQRAERLQSLRDNRELRQAVRRPAPVVSNVPRPGTQPPLRVERNSAPIQWSSNWRNNNKYDWQNHRRHHRSIFHLGFYYDPFGWNYNPFQIGWRMWPSYYSSRYWINDPWYYRLPYAPPGTRWVRYYDDAILVDTWTGEVVDVIYNFFW